MLLPNSDVASDDDAPYSAGHNMHLQEDWEKSSDEENHKVFWCFQGIGKGCIGNKWVNENMFLIANVKNLFG